MLSGRGQTEDGPIGATEGGGRHAAGSQPLEVWFQETGCSPQEKGCSAERAGAVSHMDRSNVGPFVPSHGLRAGAAGP